MQRRREGPTARARSGRAIAARARALREIATSHAAPALRRSAPAIRARVLGNGAERRRAAWTPLALLRASGGAGRAIRIVGFTAFDRFTALDFVRPFHAEGFVGRDRCHGP